MADEQQEPQAETPVAEQTDDDFDWGAYFADEHPEIAAGEQAPPPQNFASDDEDDLRKQLAVAQANSTKALEMATQAQNQSRMQGAIDAWKAQASPAEQSLSGLLLQSKTPEELQANAKMVREAASTLGAAYDERLKKDRVEMERTMQKEYGIPIPPSFTPIPEEEKVNQMLKDGDLDGAANAMLKGVFNS